MSHLMLSIEGVGRESEGVGWGEGGCLPLALQNQLMHKSLCDEPVGVTQHGETVTPFMHRAASQTEA